MAIIGIVQDAAARVASIQDVVATSARSSSRGTRHAGMVPRLGSGRTKKGMSLWPPKAAIADSRFPCGLVLAEAADLPRHFGNGSEKSQFAENGLRPARADCEADQCDSSQAHQHQGRRCRYRLVN